MLEEFLAEETFKQSHLVDSFLNVKCRRIDPNEISGIDGSPENEGSFAFIICHVCNHRVSIDNFFDHMESCRE